MVKDFLGANERMDDMVGWRLEVIACWRDICTRTYHKVQK